MVTVGYKKDFPHGLQIEKHTLNQEGYTTLPGVKEKVNGDHVDSITIPGSIVATVKVELINLKTLLHDPFLGLVNIAMQNLHPLISFLYSACVCGCVVLVCSYKKWCYPWRGYMLIHFRRYKHTRLFRVQFMDKL